MIDIANCTHFTVQFINATHFRPTINCRYTRSLSSSALVTTIARMNDSAAEWTLIEAPFFSYTKNLSSRIEMGEDTLVRGVFSPSNSYV